MDTTTHDPLYLTYVIARRHGELRRDAAATRLRRRVARRRSAR
jgi:hypothetical protein